MHQSLSLHVTAKGYMRETIMKSNCSILWWTIKDNIVERHVHKTCPQKIHVFHCFLFLIILLLNVCKLPKLKWWFSMEMMMKGEGGGGGGEQVLPCRPCHSLSEVQNIFVYKD